MSCNYRYIWWTCKRLLTQLVKVTCSKTGLRQVDERLPCSASCHVVNVRSLDHPAAVMVVLKATPFSARAEQLAALVLWLENTSVSVPAADSTLQPSGRRLSAHRYMRSDTANKQFITCSNVFSCLYWSLFQRFTEQSLEFCSVANVAAGFTWKPVLDCLCFSKYRIVHFDSLNFISSTLNRWNACPLCPVTNARSMHMRRVSCFKDTCSTSGNESKRSKPTLTSPSGLAFVFPTAVSSGTVRQAYKRAPLTLAGFPAFVTVAVATGATYRWPS